VYVFVFASSKRFSLLCANAKFYINLRLFYNENALVTILTSA